MIKNKSFFLIIWALCLLTLGLNASVEEPEPLPSLATPAEADENAASLDQEAPPADTLTTDMPVYPSGTFGVARLKSFATLVEAIDSLKTWVNENPSVQTLAQGEWEAMAAWDPKETLADYLQLTASDIDDYFGGPLTLYLGSDFAWAKQSGMLPIVVEMTASSPETAAEFVEMLKNEDEVIDSYDEGDGITRLQVDTADPTAETTIETNTLDKPQSTDFYIAQEGTRVIMSNQKEYLIICQKAIRTPEASNSNEFWSQSADKDIAVWVAASPFVDLVEKNLEEKAKDPKAPGMKIDPQIIDNLGLSEIQGVGITAQLSPSIILQTQLMYDPEAVGIAKIFTVCPTGLEPTPLLPEDTLEFTLGRIDVANTFAQIRRLFAIAIPATEVMYTGWAKEMQELYDTDVQRQLWDAFGDRYVIYTHGSGAKVEGTAIYIAAADAPALTTGLEQFFKFFAQGKEVFDKRQVAGNTVWSLKSEFASPSAPPLAYTVTPQWVIISVGDPTQIEELIDATHRTELIDLWQQPMVADGLEGSTKTSISYRPLANLLREIAAGIIQVEERNAKKEGRTPTVSAADFPSFEEIKGSIVITSHVESGQVGTTLKISTDE